MGGGVMKMKGNLISSISIIFILLVSMAMTGCATPLHIAAARGDINAVKALLEQRADVNKRDKNGSTPLNEASSKGHANIVSLLIEKGADTTITATLPSLGKKTPLEIAEKFNKTIITKMIREAGKKQNEISLKVEKKQSAEIIPTSFSKSDVDELPSIKAKPNKNSYAIVIGIEQYRQKLPKADFATQDA